MGKMGNVSAPEMAFYNRYKHSLKKLSPFDGEYLEVVVVKRHFPDFKFGSLYIEFKGHPRREWVEKVRALSAEQKRNYRVVLQKGSTKYQKQAVTTMLTELGIQWAVNRIPDHWYKDAGLLLPDNDPEVLL